MTAPEIRELRRLARELGLPASLVEAALACGALEVDESPESCRRRLRQARRLMLDLGVNAAGAAHILQLRRRLEVMQAEMARLRRLEAALWSEWIDGVWRELDEQAGDRE